MSDPRAIIEDLRAEIANLKAEVTSLQAENAKLREQLGLNSGNSSKPPSSDPIGKRPAKPPRRNGPRRKPGGQPGHEGTHREMLPATRVDRVVDLKPDRCSGCGKRLSGADSQPAVHQTVELPEVRATVTEYRAHALTCACCGTTTRAGLPQAVGRGLLGPKFTAFLALLTGAFRLSKRGVHALLREAFDVDLSLGAIVAAERRMSEALERPYDEAKKHLEGADVAHVDETGWREGGKYATLWTGVTSIVTVFMIAASRAREAANKLLGEFAGILVVDRYVVYASWPAKWKQYCWSHLKRTFTKFKERGGAAGRIGEGLLRQTRSIFKWWHKARDGTVDRATFEKAIGRIRTRVKDLLEAGEDCGQSQTANTCCNLLDQFEALWTFASNDRVDPTNNAAERALRPAVLWRKSSFGTWSDEGSRFAERMLTATSSLRQQGRNVLQFLTDCYTAFLNGQPCPSLLPTPEVAALANP